MISMVKVLWYHLSYHYSDCHGLRELRETLPEKYIHLEKGDFFQTYNLVSDNLIARLI